MLGDYLFIVMRADGVPRVLINQRIYAEMKNELVNEKNLRLALISDGSVKHLLLRVSVHLVFLLYKLLSSSVILEMRMNFLAIYKTELKILN